MGFFSGRIKIRLLNVGLTLKVEINQILQIQILFYVLLVDCPGGG